ncbi:uncharacterized protein METZ01_LOCUS168919, partial [marine metagenome]
VEILGFLFFIFSLFVAINLPLVLALFIKIK